MKTRNLPAGADQPLIGRAVYSDKWLPIFEALGTILDAPKVTDVTWEAGEWVARLRSTGRVIGRGKIREEVVRQEVAFLNQRIAQGKEI